MKNKYFLLIAGDQYYPERGSGDWVDAYETIEQAESQVNKITNDHYEINHKKYDWYTIVDLRPWIMEIV